jgi:hypothetical protein
MFVKNLTQTKYGISNKIKVPSSNQRWLTPDDRDEFFRGGSQSVEIYKKILDDRRARYPDWQQRLTDEAVLIANEIDDKGYYKIEGFWDIDFLNQIRDETYEMIKEADSEKVKFPQDGRHTQIIHPLKNIELTNKMASNEMIQAIATAFLGASPSLGTTNMRLSEADKSENLGTNMFHKDFNSPVRLIKFFTYFNDVTMENGPFTYVESSNRRLPSDPHWSSIHRWPDGAIESLYGADKIINHTASYGDLLIATTNGFHKGLVLEKGERLMLTLNYILHPECGGSGFAGPPQGFHAVTKETYDATPPENQRLYDFTDKV